MKKKVAKTAAHSGSETVDAFMAELKHPLKAAIEVARRVVTAAACD